QLLAVQIGGVERGVTLAVLRDGAADFAADEDLGFAVRADRPAGFRRRAIDDPLNREMLTVTEPHAMRHRMPGAAATLGHAFRAMASTRVLPTGGGSEARRLHVAIQHDLCW